MSKWDEYKSFKNWQNINEQSLRSEYRQYVDNYTPGDECDGVSSFDDFCMGKWQWLD